MTEVPDHLLQRSNARRAALGLGGDAPAAAPTAASAPADDAGTAVEKAAATPARGAGAAVEAAPKVVAPLPPVVEAAIRRKRVPVWAMPVVAFLPVWGVLYAQTLSEPPSTELTQLEAGKEIYTAKCAGCHGGSGGGGTGRKLAACEVVKTFPDIRGQLEFVSLGSAKFGELIGTPTYGDPKRDGGAHKVAESGNMPPWAAGLKPKEILEVVRYERETLGGEKVDKALIDAKGARYWAAGKPMVSAAGDLIGPDGKPLLKEGELVEGQRPAYETGTVEAPTCG